MRTQRVFPLTLLIAMVVFLAMSLTAPTALADPDPHPEPETKEENGTQDADSGDVGDPTEREGTRTDEPAPIANRPRDEMHRDRRPTRDDERPQREWKLSAEDRAEITTFLEDNFPKTLEHLQEVRSEDPGRARRGEIMLFALYKMTGEYPEDLQVVAFGNTLRRHAIGKLAKEYRETEDEETKEEIKAELKEKIEESFDADIQLKKYHLEQAEAKVDEMRERLEAHESDKDAEVAKTLERVLSGERPERPRPMHDQDSDESDREKSRYLQMLREAHPRMDDRDGEDAPRRDRDKPRRKDDSHDEEP